MAAVAIFVGGCFCVGWACLAAWLGRHAESRLFLKVILGRLLYLAFLSYLGSVLMISVELMRT